MAEDKKTNHKIVYLQCYFVTIATILGTGILGLPVTLSHSGLYPFLVSFFLGFFVQSLLIWLFTDVLQRAHAVQVKNVSAHPENVPLNELDIEEDFDDLDIEEENEANGPVMAGHIIIPKEHNVQPPNLHLLGELFLPCGLRQMFDAVLIIQFIAMLISYALAGSEAYAQVIGIDHFYVIPVFVWLLTFAIVFALGIVQPLVSALTFAKGSLLLATVIVTFFVGASIHHEVSNNFTYVGAPFLMGTVALGGIVNVMPFLYGKIHPVPNQVNGFRNAIVMGLTTCFILNILWCWAVLDIVPQQNTCFLYQVKHNNSFHTIDDPNKPLHKPVCAQNLSLQSASDNGEISTIPLTQIINHLYPAYKWVAILVEAFIMISITVSYLTIGAAMHHTLCGWVKSMVSPDKISSYTSKLQASKRWRFLSTQCVCQSTLSIMAFAVVFCVAMLNPKGFEIMLEKAASLFMNLEVGLFVYLMIHTANNEENRQLKIPCPVWKFTSFLQYIIPVYFLFAVVYDIFTSAYEIAHRGVPLPWERLPSAPGSIKPIDEQEFLDYTNRTGGQEAVEHYLTTFGPLVTDFFTTTPSSLTTSLMSFTANSTNDTV